MKEKGRPVGLTIAGSDPSGGAGIQADLKTFHQHGVYGTSALTLLTVQNTRSVAAVEVLRPEFVLAQIDAVLSDMHPAAAKTGALGSAGVVEVVARRMAEIEVPLVVDPVMISKHGVALLPEDGRKALASRLLRRCFLVTPNLHEAEALAGTKIGDDASLREAAVAIARLGPQAVLVKGGHVAGSAGVSRSSDREATDILYYQEAFHSFRAEHISTDQTHGTGCTYSAAITANLALGHDLIAAVGAAKRYITRAIRTNPGLGRGLGPVNHHAEIT